jgi:hypothetical protein
MLLSPISSVSWLSDFSTMKMEAIRSSETSVYTKTTRRHIPKDGILHIPVTGDGGQWGCETSRLPHFLDSRIADGGEVVNLNFTPGRFQLLI